MSYCFYKCKIASTLFLATLLFGTTGISAQSTEKSLLKKLKPEKIIEIDNEVIESSITKESDNKRSEIEKSKDEIYDKAVNFANWVDRFFGTREELASAEYDYLRLVNNFSYLEGESPKYRPRIKAKVHLPQLKNTSLFFSNSFTDTSEDLLLDENGNRPIGTEDDEKLSAAINYETDTYRRSKFDLRFGINSSIDIFAFVKHSLPLLEREELQIQNFNYLFWREEEGFGVSTELELNQILDENTLFRWKYSLLRSEKSLGNEWRNKFSLINQLSEESWIAYELRINGDTRNQYNVENYKFSIRFRNQTSIDWLYWEVEPEILYIRTPDSLDREMVPGITIRLEVQFEKS